MVSARETRRWPSGRARRLNQAIDIPHELVIDRKDRELQAREADRRGRAAACGTAAVGLLGAIRGACLLKYEMTGNALAEHVTVVVPSGNVAREAGAHVTATLPAMPSSAEALKVVIAPAALVASRV